MGLRESHWAWWWVRGSPASPPHSRLSRRRCRGRPDAARRALRAAVPLPRGPRGLGGRPQGAGRGGAGAAADGPPPVSALPGPPLPGPSPALLPSRPPSPSPPLPPGNPPSPRTSLPCSGSTAFPCPPLPHLEGNQGKEQPHTDARNSGSVACLFCLVTRRRTRIP